jgi:hypothetical protein
MGIGRLLVGHKHEILARWRTRVGKKLGGGTVDRATLEDGWGAFLDTIAQRLERAGQGDEHVETIDGSAHGAQRLCLGFDATEIVRETGLLHVAIVEIAGERGCVWDAGEQRLLVRCFYAALATAVGEHTRRRDAEVERETVDQLGRLAGRLDGGNPRGATLRQLHALAESRAAWPPVASVGERFTLAAVLAGAVADVADAARERGVTVLFDLATPIEIDGARDLLRRAIVRVLGSAIGATRRGGSVIVRAQILSGGRVRIDIQDECGRGATVAPPGHFSRPTLALAPQRAAADWSIVRRAIAANRGTVHTRRLPGLGCLVTIDVPGRGEEEPCCDGDDADDADDAATAAAVTPPPAVGLRERAVAVADQLRRVVDGGVLDEAPPPLRACVMSSVAELATRAGVDEVAIARAERALVELYRNVTARTTSSCVSTLSKRT